MRRLLAVPLIVCLINGCNRAPEQAVAKKPEVWVINGLDVPLDVSVAGQRVRVAGHGHLSVETAATDIEFVATTTDGREVDRAQLHRKPDHKVAYNILGAAPLLFGKETYVPESRKDIPVVGDGGGHTEILEKVVEKYGIPFFLEHPPETVTKDKADRHDDELWRHTMRINGDWKATVERLTAEERHEEAWKFAETIAAVEPDNRGAKQIVEKLALPFKWREAHAAAAAMPPSWEERSKDFRARVEQKPVGPGMCNTTCAVDKATVWTVNECLGNNGPTRFVSNDCNTLVVMRAVGEGSWRHSPVIFIYSQGQLDSTKTAGDFVRDESAIRIVGEHFTWLRPGVRLSSDGKAVEFNTADGRPHRVLMR